MAKTVMSEHEVNRVVTDVIPLTLQKLPYNGQDSTDKMLAEHFMLRGISSAVNARLRKLDEAAKTAYKEGTPITMSQNYRRELSEGTARELFDLDKYIQLIVEEYPDVLHHKLRELASGATKLSAAPMLTEISYIGDIPRKEK